MIEIKIYENLSGAYVQRVMLERVWPMFGWHPWTHYKTEPEELIKSLEDQGYKQD